MSLPFVFRAALNRSSRRWLPVLLAAGLFMLTACGDMRDQARADPLEASDFFSDQRSARQQVEGAVAWNVDPNDTLLLTGMDADGNPSEEYPFEVTEEVLQRGRERYEIFCTPCHGYDGNGQGMIVQRGFSPPPSLHEDRLRQAPAGYIFDVITHGFGRMYPYDYRIHPADRWAIVAYIRALQLSQNATADILAPEDTQQLQGTTP